MFLTCKKAIQFFFYLYHLFRCAYERFYEVKCQTYKKVTKKLQDSQKKSKKLVWHHLFVKFGDTFLKGVKGGKSGKKN